VEKSHILHAQKQLLRSVAARSCMNEKMLHFLVAASVDGGVGACWW